MASQPRPDIPALLLRFHHQLVSIGSVFTGKCGSREGLPVLSRRRWKLATRPAGHPCPRRASRPSGRRPHLRAAVLCAGSGVDGQPADLRNPGRGRGCPCYLDGVGNRSAARMAERGFHRASWRQDAGRGTVPAAGTVPKRRKGLRQLAGGMDRLRLPEGSSRRYGGGVNWLTPADSRALSHPGQLPGGGRSSRSTPAARGPC